MARPSFALPTILSLATLLPLMSCGKPHARKTIDPTCKGEACSQISKDLKETTGTVPDMSPKPDPVAADESKKIGYVPEGRLWRLTNEQYVDAVDSVLNRKTGLEKLFEATSQLDDAFGNEAAHLPIDTQYASTLEIGLNRVVKASKTKIEELLPCKKIESINSECLKGFISGFGQKAFRRPVTEEETKRYLAVYDSLFEKAGATEAFTAVAEVILRSPNTIFRTEIGTPHKDGIRLLAPDELAVALSYGLTNSAPDDLLLAKAKDGTLADPTVYQAEAQRLLAGDGFVKGFTDYTLRWSKVFWMDTISKNQELFPEYDDALKKAMKDQVVAFASNTVKRDKSSFVAFLSSKQTTITPALATYYGVPVFEGSKETTASEGERGGILTLPAVLATMSADAGTAPMHRASFLMNDLMCDKPAPPPEVFPEIKPTDGKQTFRERFSAHVDNVGCSGCHVKMDAYGFSLDHYDPIGRFRTKEEGGTVNASGVLKRQFKENIPYKSAVDLIEKLAQDDEAQRCFIRKAFIYVNGRSPAPEDQALLDHLYTSFVSSKLDMSNVFLNLVTAESFKSRKEGN